jgi:probable phosphoglycerate mutase
LIYLIRHGETPGNRERRVQVPETPLSDRGLAQAARLAARLREAGLVRLLSSDLARARMTAEAVAEVTGLPLELDPLYQERNFGDLRGTLYADLEFDLFAPHVEPPGGESWSDFDARVDRAWAHARAAAHAAGGPIAVVTHGLVCHSLVSRHLHGAAAVAAGGAPLRFGNTSLSMLRPGPTDDAPWQIDLLDCTAHLDAEHADDAASISGL